MRKGYEINPFLRRDDVSKWWFISHEASATISKFAIVTEHVQDRRLGVKLAQAGTNAYSLWFAQQDVAAGNKGQFFRTGIVSWTTADPVGTPVYLSDTTPGALTTTVPTSEAIVVGHVADTNEVFLDLPGARAAGTSAHLAYNEYWVTDSQGQRENRQFPTITAALTQAQSDLPAGEDIVIRVMGNQVHTLPNIANTHPVHIHDGTIFLNGATVSSGATLTLHECLVTGAATLENITAYFWGCQFAQADITVNTDGAATDCEVLMYNCTGMPQFTHSSSTTVANFDLRMEGCTFRNSSILPNPSLVQCSNGTVIMIGGSLSSEASADTGFISSAPAGKSTTFLFYDTNFNYPDDAQLISDTGTVAPTVQFNGSRIRTGASGVGVAHTTDGMSIVDIGDRAGARVSQDPSESLRPTYESGRSLSMYSTAVGALLGHQECIEFEYTTAVDDAGIDGTIPAAGGTTSVAIPDGEVWSVTAYRVGRNGSTTFSDRRHFTVTRSGTTVTVVSGAAPTGDAGTSVGQVTLVPGSGVFKVVCATNVGWDARVTLVINTALYKGAL
jgi:hypothetical protein